MVPCNSIVEGCYYIHEYGRNLYSYKDFILGKKLYSYSVDKLSDFLVPFV